MLPAKWCSRSNGRTPRGAAHWDKLLAQFGDACRLLGAQPICTDETVDDITAETEVHRLFHIILEHVEWADIILTHWQGDSHQAHRAVSRAVELGTRPFRTQKTVMCFEIATSTDHGVHLYFLAELLCRLDGRRS